MGFAKTIPLLQMQCSRRPDRTGGFTLLEVIAVLVIIAILAVVAVARFTDAGAESAAAANTLKAHLRYAQLRAMGDIVPWGISFTGSSYTLEREGAEAPVNLPGEDGSTKTLENVTINPTDTVTFSPALGRPDPAPDPNGHTISVGGRTIFITAETGFIE